MLSKFSLVFINTTASSKVVNHASTVNVFSRKNSQFELPQNFISQIDRGSIALSLEYHFSNESVTARFLWKAKQRKEETTSRDCLVQFLFYSSKTPSLFSWSYMHVLSIF